MCIRDRYPLWTPSGPPRPGSPGWPPARGGCPLDLNPFGPPPDPLRIPFGPPPESLARPHLAGHLLDEDAAGGVDIH
eukprot:1600246-Pyramimonas_sp.AAC.1